MALPLRLLTGTVNISGDLPNLLVEEEIEEREIGRDPTLRSLIDANVLNPTVQKVLVQQDNARIQRERAERGIEDLQGEIHGEPGESIIATLFGVPVGFQVGTWLGVKNPIARFMIDLIADPLIFITGIAGIGVKGASALTKVGKAAASLKGLSAVEKADNIIRGARAVGRMYVSPTPGGKLKPGGGVLVDGIEGQARAAGTLKARMDFARSMERAANAFKATGDTSEVRDIIHMFKQFGKKPLDEATLRELHRIDPDLARFLSNEKKALKELKAAFTAVDRFDKIERAEGFVEAVAKGQRGFVTFGIPFTDVEIGLGVQKILGQSLQRIKGGVGPQIKEIGEGVGRTMFLDNKAIHIGKGIDPAQGEQVLGQAGKTMSLLERSISGKAIAEKLGKEAYGRSPDGIVEITSREINAVDQGSNLLSADMQKIFGPGEVDDVVGEILGDPALAGRVDDIQRAQPTRRLFENDPRFQALNPTQRSLALGLRAHLDDVGVTAQKLQVVDDLINNYFTINLKVSRTPVQEDIAALLTELKRHPKLSGQGRKHVRMAEALIKGDEHDLFAAGQQTLDALKEMYRGVIKAKRSGRTIGSRFSYERMTEGLKQIEALIVKYPSTVKVQSKKASVNIPTYLRAMGSAAIRQRMLNTLRTAKVQDETLKAIGFAPAAFSVSSDLPDLLPSKLLRATDDISEQIRSAEAELRRQKKALKAAKPKKAVRKESVRKLSRLEEELAEIQARTEGRLEARLPPTERLDVRRRRLVEGEIAAVKGSAGLAGDPAMAARARGQIAELESVVRDLKEDLMLARQTPAESFDPANTAIRALGLADAPTGVRGKFKRGPRYVKLKNEAFKDYRFHNSIAPHVRGMFETDWFKDLGEGGSLANMMFRGLQNANSAMKASLFHLNPAFHAMALTLSNFMTNPLNVAVKNVGDIWKIALAHGGKDPDKAMDAIIRIMSRAQDINGKDLFEEMMLSNLKLGRAQEDADMAYGVFEGMFKAGLERTKDHEFLQHAIRGGMHVNAMFDKFLWTIVQNTFKINTWAHVRQTMLNRFAKKGREITNTLKHTINGEAAQITNQAFGGLAWERLAVEPAMKTVARWAMLAPDWTTSNLLMARDLFVNIPGIKSNAIGKMLTRDVLLADQRFIWAMQYNLRAAVYAFFGANLMNYAFTAMKDGEGRWLFQNDDEAIDHVTGLKTRVEMPWTTNDGRRQYMDILRQFTEPLKAVVNFPSFVSSKMGALPRVFQTMVVGVDGFGRAVAGATDGPYQDIVKRIATTSGQFVPIAAQQIPRAIEQGPSGLPRFALSTLGFPTNTENMANFKRRERIRELEQIAAQANSF